MRYSSRSCLFGFTLILAGIAMFALQDAAFAAKDLTGLSTDVGKQIQGVTKLLIIIAYIAGVGFALAGIMQFKAHKDNPTQVPLSKPIVLLIVGSLLIYLPTVLQSAGQTVFGSEKTATGGSDGSLELK